MGRGEGICVPLLIYKTYDVRINAIYYCKLKTLKNKHKYIPIFETIRNRKQYSLIKLKDKQILLSNVYKQMRYLKKKQEKSCVPGHERHFSASRDGSVAQNIAFVCPVW